MDQKQTFEEALQELEKLAQDMEQKELTLEEALSKFERGIILSQFCKTRLEQAQGKIVQLTKENKLEDFMQSDE